MGLDVYAGGLTRYITGDWETAVQRAAREQGVSCEIEGRQWVRDAPESVRAAMEEWKGVLDSALQSEVGAGVDWDESEEAPYFTRKPDWSGWSCLVLLAAYEEQPHLARPESAVLEWQGDPAWAACLDLRSRTFGQILFPELWLPVEHDVVFRADLPWGGESVLGSTMHLLKQLADRNDATLKANARSLARWRRDGVDPQAPFLEHARFGLAVALELVEHAVQARVPVKLDY